MNLLRSDFLKLGPIALAGLMLAACQTLPRGEIAKSPVISLRDIGGLEGGADIYVYGDDTCLIRRVEHQEGMDELQERRFFATLPTGTTQRLIALAQKTKLTAYGQKRFTCVPEEGYPWIFWRTPAGLDFLGKKFVNDADPHFDPVYKELARLAELSESLASATHYRGVYQYDWGHPAIKARSGH